MTAACVVTWSALAARARKPGASSVRSNTLRFTTMIVSIVGAGRDWALRRSGARAVSSTNTNPTAGPPDRRTGLLDQLDALMQRVGDVTSGIVPLRKIQRRVDPAGDLAQAARRHAELAPHRIRSQRATEARHGGVRRDAGRRGTKGVRHVLAQLPHVAEVEAERDRVLVSLGGRSEEHTSELQSRW